MKVFILRHGQAEAQITTDQARQLTSKGRSDAAAILKARVANLNSVAQIWASPLVRAQQTAEIAAVHFPQLNIQTTNLLVPEASPQALIDWLGAIESADIHQSILLVSHQPLVGTLVNRLCGKPEDYFPMGTSSLAAVDLPMIAAGMGELLWLDHI
jgi:phosphohistidine phosphatase